MNKFSSSFVVFIFSFLPIVFWIIAKPLDLRFSGFVRVMTSLGQISGLVGLALFAITLILQARLKILDRFFQGLDKVYLQHHNLGSIAFILLLFHPLFLGIRLIHSSFAQAMIFFIPGNDFNVTFGIVALSLMIIFLAMTFYFRLNYQSWKSSHQYLGMAFFFSSVHSLLVPSDISSNLGLRIYMLVLITLGLLALIYRVVLGKLLIKKAEYLVDEVNSLGGKVSEVFLKPAGKALDFIPGQFVFASFKSTNLKKESHPFSISSAPQEPRLRLSIKNLGDFTSTITGLKLGDKVKLEGPFGHFSYTNSQNSSQVWIAGGIGITPFLSMARSLKNDGPRVWLFYCTKNLEEAVFLKELEEISGQNPRLKAISYCSDQKGRLNSEGIELAVGNLKEKDFLICGPGAMMHDLSIQLKDKGVLENQIFWEDFDLR
jgi:predicted ferric reductase